jgi:hypothetical protein
MSVTQSLAVETRVDVSNLLSVHLALPNPPTQFTSCKPAYREALHGGIHLAALPSWPVIHAIPTLSRSMFIFKDPATFLTNFSLP